MTFWKTIKKKAHQHLYFRWRLKRSSMLPNILLTFCRCTVENVMIGCITVWFNDSNTQKWRRLRKVIDIDRSIMGVDHQKDLHEPQPQKGSKCYQRFAPHCPHSPLAASIGEKLQEPKNRDLHYSFFPSTIRQWSCMALFLFTLYFGLCYYD